MQDPLETVKKLLAMANDDGASENEVKIAMQHARRLMTQHSIDEADLVEKPDSNIVDGLGGNKAGWVIWEKIVASAVGATTDTRPLIKKSHTNDAVQIRFIGFNVDVTVAQHMFPSLLVTIRTMARMKLGKGWTSKHRSYAHGFADELNLQATQQKRAEAQSTEIIHRKDVAIDKWLDENMNVGHAKRTRHGKIDREAYNAGRQDGRNIGMRQRFAG